MMRAFALASLLLQGAITSAQAPGPKVADAKDNELRVIASGALQGPLDSMRTQAASAAKWPLAIQYGAARGGLRDEILAGQAFEVAILVPDVNRELIAKGLASAKTYQIARVPIAIGIRGDIPTPDVSTPAALKAVLLGAKLVRYQPNGAGRPTVDKILDALGIADAIKDANKTGASPNNAPLAAGEYELSIFPMSEIAFNRDLTNLGAVIPEFQVPVIIEAVIGKQARDVKAAQRLIKYLRSPAFEPALQKVGMSKG